MGMKFQMVKNSKHGYRYTDIDSKHGIDSFQLRLFFLPGCGCRHFNENNEQVSAQSNLPCVTNLVDGTSFSAVPSFEFVGVGSPVIALDNSKTFIRNALIDVSGNLTLFM